MPSYDPQASAITGAFVGALNDYLFRDLGYKTPLTYRPEQLWRLSAATGASSTRRRMATADRPTPASDLAAAMRENPRMKLLSVNGLYDLATPFGGADYEIRPHGA